MSTATSSFMAIHLNSNNGPSAQLGNMWRYAKFPRMKIESHNITK